MKHRSRGFSKENVEATNKIIEYKKNNPEASQREIAAACDVSVGKVNKSINKEIDKADAAQTNKQDAETNNQNTDGSPPPEKKVQDMQELVDGLSIQDCRGIVEAYKARTSYNEIRTKYNLLYINQMVIDLIQKRIQKHDEESIKRQHYYTEKRIDDLQEQLSQSKNSYSKMTPYEKEQAEKEKRREKLIEKHYKNLW